jgi:superfamily I DNA/RNA helicase/DNA polymerase III epsilon subunit-like protein
MQPAAVDNILADLNERQLAAVTAPPGPALVLAGPGSGKTHIITRRAAWLVATGAASSPHVLCVTFTNRAAQEMRTRLVALLGDPARDIWVYTFHALCTRILRRYGGQIELPAHFMIADEGLQTEIVVGALRGRDLSLEEYPPYRILDFISQHKRNLQDPAQAPISEEIPPALVEIAIAYNVTLAARALLDFDDLIGQTVRLLARDRAVRLALQRGLPHIMVDEYQDINRAQFELLKMLAPTGHDVLAVADAAQSIYSWRGAQPGLIDAYRHHYRPTVVELNTSYRATQTILFAAEHLIRHNDPAYREGETTGVTLEPGAPIFHYVFETPHQEQTWLVQLIRRLVAERGYEYGDVAILYRTHSLADELEGALLQAGIPLERVRRDSFFQEPSVREVVRYLRLARSLAGDDLLAAFNFPQTLADELTILQLRQLAIAHSLGLAELARRADQFPELGPLTRAELSSFIRLFDERLHPLAEAASEEAPDARQAAETGLSADEDGGAETVAPANDEEEDLSARGGDAAAVVAALFDALTERRSPFLPAELAVLRDAAAFFSFTAAASALRDALARHGEAGLTAPATPDGACAAAILSEAIGRYLGGRLVVDLTTVNIDEPKLDLRLAPDQPPLAVRPPSGALQYSLSAVAWRLAQELLMAHETAASGPLVVYDLETTGLDLVRDDIVEIAAQRLEEGEPVGPPFYSLVRPTRAITLSAWRVHHISPADVRNAEPIEAVLPRFLRYVGAAPVVGHNITRFDNRFIDRETGRLYGRGFPNPAIDTLDMAVRLYGEDPEVARSMSLESLLARLGIAEAVEHRAGADVGQTLALFRRLLWENDLQRGLAALPEYLPLVAAGMAAAGVPVVDENLTLWRGGKRILTRQTSHGLELPGLATARGLLEAALPEPAAALAALDAALASLRAATPPPPDAAWLTLQDRFAAHLESFARFSTDRSLDAFLDYEALVTGADTTPRGRTGDRVTMMTLHNAKGTEYPVVIIVGLEEDNLPLWTSLEDEGQLREERRVFYVGVTRAQRQLYLTSVRQRPDHLGLVRHRAVSRFAGELPPEYVRRFRINPRGEVQELTSPGSKEPGTVPEQADTPGQPDAGRASNDANAPDRT